MIDTRLQLLEFEQRALRSWLAGFDGAGPSLGLAPSGQTLWIKDFPLPDHFRPDRISIAMVVRDYPQDPPKGLYLLREAENTDLLARLCERFNIFQEQGFHGAVGIPGYDWICVGYLEGWRFNARAPHKGDNIVKMMQEFWRLLEEQ